MSGIDDKNKGITLNPTNLLFKTDDVHFRNERKTWEIAIQSRETHGRDMGYRGFVRRGDEQFIGENVTLTHNLAEGTMSVIVM